MHVGLVEAAIRTRYRTGWHQRVIFVAVNVNDPRTVYVTPNSPSPRGLCLNWPSFRQHPVAPILILRTYWKDPGFAKSHLQAHAPVVLLVPCSAAPVTTAAPVCTTVPTSNKRV